jgi:hypothetical protein
MKRPDKSDHIPRSRASILVAVHLVHPWNSKARNLSFLGSDQDSEWRRKATAPQLVKSERELDILVTKVMSEQTSSRVEALRNAGFGGPHCDGQDAGAIPDSCNQSRELFLG